MSVLKGFEDLKPHDVVAFNGDGTLLIVVKDEVQRLQLCVNPTGTLSAHPIEHKQPDQLQERKKVPAALRWAQTDQGQAAINRGEL